MWYKTYEDNLVNLNNVEHIWYTDTSVYARLADSSTIVLEYFKNDPTAPREYTVALARGLDATDICCI